MKHTHLTAIFSVIICICSSFERLYAQSESNQELINYLFQDYSGEKPSANFTVIKDGKVKDCQSFGYADFKNKVLATCETNYRLGSATKQFTAMAILILIDRGQLNYETKLTEVIPEFPDYGKEVTIKNLLTHRSGLPDYFELYDKTRKEQLDDSDVLNLLKKQDSLLFPVNSRSKYSNSAYAILSIITERVSKKSFKQFMDDEIFQKIGMTNSTIYQKDLDIKNRAFGYKLKDSIYKISDHNLTSAVKGDGGVYSSVNDFYLWDKSFYENTLISANLKEDAFTSWDGKEKAKKRYGFGFGWLVSFKDDMKYVWHGGSTIGFRTVILRIPSKKISVAIYTSSDKNRQELKRKALVLASLYSDNELLIPIDIMIEKEISSNGSENIKKYYDELTKTKNKYKVDMEELIHLGFSYLRKNENKTTLNIFTFLKTEFPRHFWGYIGLAQYYKLNGNNKKAIKYFKKAIKLATSDDQEYIDYSNKMINKLNKKS